MIELYDWYRQLVKITEEMKRYLNEERKYVDDYDEREARTTSTAEKGRD